jgi:uncharacterized membrane protein (UPF0127 family)
MLLAIYLHSHERVCWLVDGLMQQPTTNGNVVQSTNIPVLDITFFFQDRNVRMIHIKVPVCSTRRAKNGRLVLLIYTGGFCLAPLRGSVGTRRFVDRRFK